MRTKCRFTCLTGCLLFLTAVPAAEAQFSIDWFSIAGGGGTGANGQYTFSGTIGQPDACGPMTNGQYSVTGGFWVLPTLIQTPGAPTLHLLRAASGFVTLWWTPASAGFVLQSSDSLIPSNWVNAPTGTNNPATLSATQARRFYRLQSN